jgi:hypothetical protein
MDRVAYKIVWITNNLEENPEYTDTIDYPFLVKYVEDEIAGFVIDLTTKDWYEVEDFFYMVDIKYFTTSGEE